METLYKMKWNSGMLRLKYEILRSEEHEDKHDELKRDIVNGRPQTERQLITYHLTQVRLWLHYYDDETASLQYDKSRRLGPVKVFNTGLDIQDWAKNKYKEQVLTSYLDKEPWELPSGSPERISANKELFEMFKETKDYLDVDVRQ